MYHSMDYTRAKSNNTYTVKYMADNAVLRYGFICWFATSNDESDKICLIKSLVLSSVNPWNGTDPNPIQ